MRTHPTIHDHGYWQGIEACDHHSHDSNLASSLMTFLKNENAQSVVDFGCGMGNYVKTFKENNLNASGFDGNPNTPELTNNLCKVLDISVPVKFEEPFDWVLSFEVGEHLPKEFEDTFINNLHNNNKYGIILSWAVKGQGGYGHFNEQSNDYIKSKICELGYVNDIKTENILRNDATLNWFKNTIMVFRKSSV
jgi:cyclopropane fatty-acyl-phospholipid synthase-like methyltransferase